MHDIYHKPEWKSYHKIVKPYFKICKDKTVLEIAPFYGTHTSLIQFYEPKSLTLVEMSQPAVKHLKGFYPNCQVVADDIFFYLNTPKHFDVVVCAGLLYHLHSPLYLLELIVNRCSPQYLIIESFGTSGECPIEVEQEEVNALGNLQVYPDWKTAGIKFKVSSKIILRAVENLGYKLVSVDLSVPKPTGNAFLCVFEKE